MAAEGSQSYIDIVTRRSMCAQRALQLATVAELRLMLLRVYRDPEVAEMIQREIQRKERKES